jgi:hypothetical protein
MTPKEKALDLFHKYARFWHSSSSDVKQCALIAVDEMILIAPNDKSIVGTKYLTIKEYYKEVREEIEKL